jgi:hypothetical protein
VPCSGACHKFAVVAPSLRSALCSLVSHSCLLARRSVLSLCPAAARMTARTRHTSGGRQTAKAQRCRQVACATGRSRLVGSSGFDSDSSVVRCGAQFIPCGDGMAESHEAGETDTASSVLVGTRIGGRHHTAAVGCADSQIFTQERRSSSMRIRRMQREKGVSGERSAARGTSTLLSLQPTGMRIMPNHAVMLTCRPFSCECRILVALPPWPLPPPLPLRRSARSA